MMVDLDDATKAALYRNNKVVRSEWASETPDQREAREERIRKHALRVQMEEQTGTAGER